MRNETVTYKLFKFAELDPKVQSKVLDNNRDINTDFDEWYESVYEGAYEDLKAIGFEDCKIWFSGFSSQGDGACFDCKSFDFEKLVASLESRVDTKLFKKYKRFIPRIANGDFLSIRIETISHSYSHESTRKLYVELDCRRSGRHIESLIDQLQEDLEALRYDKCKEIYKQLEESYYYLTSDEAVKETIEANDYEFFESGEQY